MASSIFFGGSVLAAVIAGAIALFAPCCISFMLPAYFASAFQNRRMLVAMTVLFAAGVGTIILPLALGASVLRQVFTVGHPVIYIVGGLLLIGLAVFTLLGGQVHLPTPGRSAGGKVGPLSVYTLGIFSGITSSCCAPVLAGVLALSSVAPSFMAALGLGVAYVFGMVAPLFLISVLWERYDWRASHLFRPRTFTYRLGPLERTISATNLVSGILLAVLGPTMIWFGLTFRSMSRLTGWQANLTYFLQHVGSVLTHTFLWVPNWLAILAFAAVAFWLIRRAIRQTASIEPACHPEAIPDAAPPLNEGDQDAMSTHKRHTTKPVPSVTTATAKTTAKPAAVPAKAQGHPAVRRPATRRRTQATKVAAVAVVVVAILGWIYVANSQGAPGGGQHGQYSYQVASPGPGAMAPDFTLSSTTGQTFTLSAFHGKTILLFFQEGIGCESCWTQMVDIQSQLRRFQTMGIDVMLTITTNPLDALRQKVADEGINLPVLSDPSFTVSSAYHATEYGMMSGAADGHTFILVGPDGRIRWRGDFGGPPNYTMYVPIPTLIADLQETSNGKHP